MTKIGAYLQIGDERSLAGQKSDAANQRDSWLRQMELAQLDARTQTDTPKTPQEQMHDSPAESAKRIPARRISADSNSHRADFQMNQNSPTADTSRDMTRADNNGANTGKTSESISSSKSAIGNKEAVALVRPTQPAALTATAFNVISTITASMSNDAQAVLRSQDANVTMLPVAQARTLSASNTMSLIQNNELPEQMSLQEEPTQEAFSAAETPLEDNPIWQKRMMHMTGEGKDINIWIRDNALATAQSLKLVYRLVSDFASMGMRLNGATINGKLAYRAANNEYKAEKPGDQVDIEIEAQTTRTNVSNISIKEKKHATQ